MGAKFLVPKSSNHCHFWTVLGHGFLRYTYFVSFPLFVTKEWFIMTKTLFINPQWKFLIEGFFFHFLFSICVLFHEHSRFARQQGKGDALSLSLLCHFHLLQRHLDIRQTITAENSPLHIASSRIQTKNLWFPSASR